VTITSAIPNPVTIGNLTLVSVKVSAPGAPGVPTGIVEVKTGQQLVCQINLDPSGDGSCNLIFTASGVVPLKAVYPGDTSFLPGVSDVLELEVMDLNGDILFYRHEFETPVGSEWCLLRQDVTPTGRGFLGQFSNETACLVLKDIPQHTWLKVSFDLYLIRSWNGNQENWGPNSPNVPGFTSAEPFGADWVVGPDRFRVQADGRGLLTSTFANYPGFPQAFPGSYPGGDFPTQTGAQEINSLGYNFDYAPMDSVYHLTFVFQHSTSQLEMDFNALGLQEITNESWGLDNLQVAYNRLPVLSIYLPLLSR
jgi:Bacterial Ig-like domain (group 3)